MADDHISIKRHGKREISIYDVTPDQLDRLEQSGGDVGFNFHIAEFLLTLSCSFLGAVLLSPPASVTIRAVFVSIIVCGLLVGLIFLLKWYQERGTFASIVREIRELPEIGPLGDEKQELRPSELGALPLEAAPNVGMTDSVTAAVTPAPGETEPK